MTQLPWRAVNNSFARLEVLSADQIEAIHLAAHDAALESGFGSTAHLSRAYRKAFGCTPSSERARSRGRSA
ncbi:MAG: helix-turn-helix domain-containing protein [Gammaproteobacteria bacterium]|nr:helix-turn-helix domain-containing protein [Gammaproteobacteria bacterium]